MKTHLSARRFPLTRFSPFAQSPSPSSISSLSQVDNSTTATLIRNIEGQRGRDREPGQGKLIISRRSPPSFSSLLNSSKDARGSQREQEQQEQKQKQQLEQPFEFPIGGKTSMRHSDAIRWTLAYPSAILVNELTQVLSGEELPTNSAWLKTSRTLSPEKSAICW